MPLRRLALLTLTAAVAALLQGAPGLWPGPGRLFLALAHLPLTAVALALPRWAPTVGTAAVALLLVLEPQAVLVFILTTGPFALVLGATTASHWPRGCRLVAAATTLAAGIGALVFLMRVPLPGLDLPSLAPWQQVPVYITLAAAWSGIWLLPVEALNRHLRR